MIPLALSISASLAGRLARGVLAALLAPPILVLAAVADLLDVKR